MGRMEYWDPVTQSRKPAKAGSIVDNAGLEYTPSDVRAINDKTNTLEGELVSHKADYEYQVAMVVGRQIRVVKKSSTNIVKFKLNTDIVAGTAITISLDGGSTSKPLRDFEGLAVTELDKGFVEVVGSSVNFTLRPKGASLKFYEALLGESQKYGGSIRAIASDDDYVYFGGMTSQTVQKLRKTDMSLVAESQKYGGAIYGITSDDDYIYICGNNNPVWKIRKSSMETVSESISFGSSAMSLIVDNDNIYLSHTGGRRAVKLNKTTMTREGYLARSVSPGIDQDDIYIYATSSQIALKISKSNMAIVVESGTLGDSSDSLVVDNNHVYIGLKDGSSGKKVVRLGKSDMKKTSESYVHSNSIYALSQDTNYVYSSDGQGICKLRKLDLKKVSENLNYDGIVYSLIQSNGLIYAGGSSSQVVMKLDNILEDYCKYKDLILKKIGV